LLFGTDAKFFGKSVARFLGHARFGDRPRTDSVDARLCARLQRR
jgi:hypothetical protein